MTIAKNVESDLKATELTIPDPDEIRPRRPIPPGEIIEVENWHKELHDLRRLALNRAFDIGFKLRCWHELIPHGKWLPWLKANVAIPERTASQYLLLWDHNEEIKAAFKSAESADSNGFLPIKDALGLITTKHATKRSKPVKAGQVVHRIPAVKTPVAAPCPESAAGQATDHLEKTETDPNDEIEADLDYMTDRVLKIFDSCVSWLSSDYVDAPLALLKNCCQLYLDSQWTDQEIIKKPENLRSQVRAWVRQFLDGSKKEGVAE